MARPPKELNWEVIESYIQAGCKSGAAIARKFNLNKDTFYRKFREEYGCSFQDYHVESQEVGDIDLMRMIHAKALNNKAPGNATLLMFLASRRLGMKEPETVHTLAANQEQIDQSHLIMQLQHENSELRKEKARLENSEQSLENEVERLDHKLEILSGQS
jgi:hypothetical protein